MTRLWLSGLALAVWLDDEGIPIRLRWEEQTHPVQGISNRWRVDVRWWRARIWRDYFQLVTTTGLLLVVYHDLVDDRWYLQRMYD